MRAFKSFSTRRKNRLCNQQGAAVWQRSYWDRIIRDEPELHRIHYDIRMNPGQWIEETQLPESSPKQRGGSR